jgi:flagellar basal-body rod protein FlgB
MWIDRLLTSRTRNAVELAAQFAEQRQKVLAENLANVDTPDYHTRRLDAASFQASLGAALDRAKANDEKALELRGNAQFATGRRGGLVVAPAVEPAQNLLFHDGTNARLETLMGDVAENAMSYDLAMSLLRGQYEGLLRAIRGRTQ